QARVHRDPDDRPAPAPDGPRAAVAVARRRGVDDARVSARERDSMASTTVTAETKRGGTPAGDRPGGYAGKLLRGDVSTGRIWSQPWTPDEMRFYLGGVGLGAKILWEEVPREVGWDHPDNRLVLATGPFAGLPVWGTGGLTVITRGAMTNGATSTQANG